MNPQNTSTVNLLLETQAIEKRICTMRGIQVMLDRDLATLYQVENRALKQAVKRNLARFPQDFMFELTDVEVDILVSQSVIPSKKQLGGAKPFVFTEQGVAALSAVLTSNRAIEVNIEIMRTFVKMRQFLAHNADLFKRLDTIEIRQLTHETDNQTKFEQLFNALESRALTPKQGIFYDGQIFDAYVFVADLIKSATSAIVLIDNFIDETVLVLLSKREPNVTAKILSKTISVPLQLDLAKFNQQYPPITAEVFDHAHDRFLIIDEKTVYHIGASLKDLGKKWFAFSKMDMNALEMLTRVKL